VTDRSTPAAPLRRVHWLVRLLPLGAALVFLLGLALARPELAAGSAVARPQAGSHAQVRSTPRQTVRGYLEAARTSEWARAAEFLDLSGARLATGSEEAASLAHDLKIVLDRTAWIELALVSDSPEGARDDGLDPELERIARVPTPQGEVPILLARQTTAAGVEWRFAPDTVAAIPELYAVHGHGWVEELLPAPFFEVRVLEVELWQWLGLLLAGLLGSALAYLGTWGLARVLHHVVQRTKSSWDDELLARAASPIRFALSVLGFYLIAQFLALNAPAAAFLALACKALTVVAATWLILSMIDVLAEAVHRGLERRDVNAANTLVPIGRRATKIFVLGIALVSLIHNLGFNVAGILAGLGVGGLAVALAAQKTLENLFGGITIIADRPVEVGQVCRVGEHFGTVEEIGMRSTRLRTLDRTLVTIANAEFAGARIDNFSRRDKMRLYTVLQVGYDTTPDQMRYLLVELRRLLYAHPKVSHDPCRVRFVALNTYSLDIEVFAFVETQDWNEFLGIREDLYLRFLDVVKKSGAYFAYPSQTLYLGRDGGRDLARSAEAERAVRAWQEAGTLPLPEFPPEAIAALDDTLEFPPPGSAQHRPMA
jgi:MscS family membrane protein